MPRAAAADRPSRLVRLELAVLLLASCAPGALAVVRGLAAVLAAQP
jgi:hypothetical protein